jgi:hypothetical protein
MCECDLAALPDHPLLSVALLVVLTLHACLLPVVAVHVNLFMKKHEVLDKREVCGKAQSF